MGSAGQPRFAGTPTLGTRSPRFHMSPLALGDFAPSLAGLWHGRALRYHFGYLTKKLDETPEEESKEKLNPDSAVAYRGMPHNRDPGK